MLRHGTGIIALVLLQCQAFQPVCVSTDSRQSYDAFNARIRSERGELTALSMSSIGTLGGKGLRKKKLQTFNRYLEVECWKQSELRGLEPVLQAVAEACKQINRIVQRAKTDDLYGAALGPDGKPLDTTNIQGEVQQKLDVVCNTFMLRAFCGCSTAIHSVASEEEDEPRCCADVMVSRCGFLFRGETKVLNEKNPVEHWFLE
jgi:Fructose-1-6-bisphosphatase, N-terminal domain